LYSERKTAINPFNKTHYSVVTMKKVLPSLTAAFLATMVLFAANSANAAPKAKGNEITKVNVDSKGVILKGYDAVAYFTQGKAVKGNPAIKSTYQGATYLFSSPANKTAFDKNPAKYAPQYGGFCACGVSLGKLLDIEGPGGFVYKDRLYVCGNEAAGEIFRSEIKSNIAKADTNWAKLTGSQSQKR
ncbi:MAG: YHS domain-containing (seleno)protein, partial [Terrimicrobiaceae bacterium]